MGLEPTISCLGSKRSTTELHPRAGGIIPNFAGYQDASGFVFVIRLLDLATSAQAQIALHQLLLVDRRCATNRAPTLSTDRPLVE